MAQGMSTEIYRQMKSQFKKEGEVECPNCDLTFLTLVACKKHFAGCHGRLCAGDYVSCPHCNKKFSRLISLNQHISKVHQVEPNLTPAQYADSAGIPSLLYHSKKTISVPDPNSSASSSIPNPAQNTNLAPANLPRTETILIPKRDAVVFRPALITSSSNDSTAKFTPVLVSNSLPNGITPPTLEDSHSVITTSRSNDSTTILDNGSTSESNTTLNTQNSKKEAFLSQCASVLGRSVVKATNTLKDVKATNTLKDGGRGGRAVNLKQRSIPYSYEKSIRLMQASNISTANDISVLQCDSVLPKTVKDVTSQRVVSSSSDIPAFSPSIEPVAVVGSTQIFHLPKKVPTLTTSQTTKAQEDICTPAIVSVRSEVVDCKDDIVVLPHGDDTGQQDQNQISTEFDPQSIDHQYHVDNEEGNGNVLQSSGQTSHDSELTSAFQTNCAFPPYSVSGSVKQGTIFKPETYSKHHLVQVQNQSQESQKRKESHSDCHNLQDDHNKRQKTNGKQNSDSNANKDNDNVETIPVTCLLTINKETGYTKIEMPTLGPLIEEAIKNTANCQIVFMDDSTVQFQQVVGQRQIQNEPTNEQKAEGATLLNDKSSEAKNPTGENGDCTVNGVNEGILFDDETESNSSERGMNRNGKSMGRELFVDVRNFKCDKKNLESAAFNLRHPVKVTILDDDNCDMIVDLAHSNQGERVVHGKAQDNNVKELQESHNSETVPTEDHSSQEITNERIGVESFNSSAMTNGIDLTSYMKKSANVTTKMATRKVSVKLLNVLSSHPHLKDKFKKDEGRRSVPENSSEDDLPPQPEIIDII